MTTPIEVTAVNWEATYWKMRKSMDSMLQEIVALTQENIRLSKRLSDKLPDNDSMTSHDEKKLPTLPEYIKEHGWPDWAKYAVIYSDGIICWFVSKPMLKDEHWADPTGECSATLKEKFDATNWQNSLVEKCDTCDGEGKTWPAGGKYPSKECPTCNGTKIKPKQEPEFLTEFGKEIHDLHQKILCMKKPKLKSLADEPWPDLNEGWYARIVDANGNILMAKNHEDVYERWINTGKSGYIPTYPKIEKHPRYDDILWLRKWKGKSITNMHTNCWYTDIKLTSVPGNFIATRNDGCVVTEYINCNWYEYKKPKRVPLTAKDYRNIRGIINEGWELGHEGRIVEVSPGVANHEDTKLWLRDGQHYTAGDLAQMPLFKGITFDNKIVPLYKEER